MDLRDSVYIDPSVAGLYQCSECKRTYARVDHLARHVRSHLQDKPFVCSTCNKGFGRPDLLKRHALSHETDGRDPKRPKTSPSSRVTQACKACAAAKMKCEDEKPCRRCQRRGIMCDSSSAAGIRSTSKDVQTDQSSTPPQQQYQQQVSLEIGLRGTLGSQDFERGSNHQILTTEGTEMHSEPPPPLTYEDSIAVPAPSFHDNIFSEFLKDVLIPSSLDPLHEPELASPTQQLGTRDVLDFAARSSIDFDSADFSWYDALDWKGIAGPSDQPVTNAANLTDGADAEPIRLPDPRKLEALGVEAFKRSSFSRWLPAQQDHCFAEQHNLSIALEGPDSPDSQLKLERRVLPESLHQSSRDAVLAMVLDTCKPANVGRVVASFPTAELLDGFLQSYLSQHWSQVDCWIHVASFHPNTQRPELLGALVAAGAVSTGIAAFCKLGYALRESLPVPQALMIELELGLWSGNRRKMELAESRQQALLTMLRRTGKLQRAKFPTILPLPQDTGDILKQKWKTWVERESFKRLVFHLFIHDAQSSMSFLVNPLVSYAELSVPLPESRDLWDAQDAQCWKSRYLARTTENPGRLPSLVDCLQESSSLVAVQESCDAHFSRLIILHGFWGMVWEYLQMNSIVKSQSQQGNSSLVLNSRHQDLCQTLRDFRLSISQWEPEPSSETVLIVELLLMYLNMSLEEIQLFAGKEDKDEARRVFPSLKQWILSSSSRHAVWHAGQVFRAAKLLPRNRLQGFYAIAMYHASLALWAFGVISLAKQPNDTVVAGSSEKAVWLDGSETSELQRFLALGRGTAGVAAPPTEEESRLIQITNPSAIMEVALETLRDNNSRQTQSEALPPLVDNIVQLMGELGKAAEAVGG